jgi:hypothetical protein
MIGAPTWSARFVVSSPTALPPTQSLPTQPLSLAFNGVVAVLERGRALCTSSPPGRCQLCGLGLRLFVRACLLAFAPGLRLLPTTRFARVDVGLHQNKALAINSKSQHPLPLSSNPQAHKHHIKEGKVP